MGLGAGVQRLVFGSVLFGGTLLLCEPVVSAAPAGPPTASEQDETAALNLQSLRNSEIVNAPGVNPGPPEGVTQPGTYTPAAPSKSGSARGGGGQRAATLGGSGGKGGKSRSGGSRSGGKSTGKSRDYSEKRHRG